MAAKNMAYRRCVSTASTAQRLLPVASGATSGGVGNGLIDRRINGMTRSGSAILLLPVSSGRMFKTAFCANAPARGCLLRASGTRRLYDDTYLPGATRVAHAGVVPWATRRDRSAGRAHTGPRPPYFPTAFHTQRIARKIRRRRNVVYTHLAAASAARSTAAGAATRSPQRRAARHSPSLSNPHQRKPPKRTRTPTFSPYATTPNTEGGTAHNGVSGVTTPGI